ncbi:hypothetical protein [Pseudoalteromonas denitrificans]|uniref:Holin of 3TMs, for gene-transfer release n=1 Tax=Pseudoalteromonas denitrificans DSM 6059 TaxID=1123010 RepID=A0A1I1G0A1_9GAMM|nr:hypothetical protein [Pseudoalteromonas denitrificans]SFC04736.1 hypothetical protein SAMN02745724_00753 [Pseudoalteromonas denitrificans DSM 6059]
MEPISIALALAKLTGFDKQVGRWLGGDNGEEVASSVVDMAQIITGAKSPEYALQEIQKSEQFQKQLTQALITSEKELNKLAFENTQDARAMQIQALAQNDKFSKRFIYYFAAFWSIFSVVYIVCITFVSIPQDSVRFADTILGFILGTVIATIINFFFGSSSGNEKRTESLDLQDVLSKV